MYNFIKTFKKTLSEILSEWPEIRGYNIFFIYFLGHFGFLAYEVDEGKKLFFHMSEVKDEATLQQGDQVEFVLVTNKRTGKSSACNLTKVR